jgi:hypothetical protein
MAGGTTTEEGTVSDTKRAPRHFDVTVCAKCRDKIHPGDPKVSVGTGWVCQRCAYEARRHA